jgi:hypothetical protein
MTVDVNTVANGPPFETLGNHPGNVSSPWAPRVSRWEYCDGLTGTGWLGPLLCGLVKFVNSEVGSELL